MTLKNLTQINNYNEFNYNQFESNFKFSKTNKTPKIKEITEIIEQLEYLEKNIFKEDYKNLRIFFNSIFIVFSSLICFLVIFSLSYIMLFLIFLSAYKLFYLVYSFSIFKLIILITTFTGITFLFKILILKLEKHLNLKSKEFINLLLEEVITIKQELLKSNNKLNFILFYLVLFSVKTFVILNDFILKSLKLSLIIIFINLILGIFIIS